MKKIKSLTVIASAILMIAAIFVSSSQDYFQSNDLSRSVIQFFTNIFGIEVTDMDMFVINKYIRKVFHAIIYMVLTIIIFIILKNFKLKLFKCTVYALILCTVFAIVDEIHQSFVPARTASVRDIFIDLGGGIAGVLLCVIMIRFYRFFKKNK